MMVRAHLVGLLSQGFPPRSLYSLLHALPSRQYTLLLYLREDGRLALVLGGRLLLVFSIHGLTRYHSNGT